MRPHLLSWLIVVAPLNEKGVVPKRDALVMLLKDRSNPNDSLQP